jgi:O-antigen ligase
MATQDLGHFFSKVFLFLLPPASIFVLSSGVSDPMNVTKFLSVGIVAFGCLGALLIHTKQLRLREANQFLIAIFIFLIALCIPTFFSGSPLTQALYGIYGRNTGLITYSILAILASISLCLKGSNDFKNLVFGIVLAGGANLFYGGWVVLFGDPFKFEDKYGALFGFLGNPDFLSAFLGMLVVALISLFSAPGINSSSRLIGILLVLICLFEISKTRSQQGLFLVVIGVMFVTFCHLSTNHKFQKLKIPFVIASSTIFLAGFFGSLNHGPLAFLHKESVTFRGWYWQAAISMGKAHPITGVGLDGYGDFYRVYRSKDAVNSLGTINKFSDTAHNVMLDMFASGGLPLLLSYLFVMAVALRSLVLVLSRMKKFDPLFVSIAGVWITYQAQSIISINQIGLATWGWVFTGALVAYENSTRHEDSYSGGKIIDKSIKRIKGINFVLSTGTAFFVGAIIGMLIVLPPFLSDSHWVSALKSRDLKKIEAEVNPNYFSPPSTYKYISAIALLDFNNLPEDARTINLRALEFNQNSFPLWKALYLRSNSTVSEKNQALSNLKRLDPFTQDPTTIS